MLVKRIPWRHDMEGECEKHAQIRPCKNAPALQFMPFKCDFAMFFFWPRVQTWPEHLRTIKTPPLQHTTGENRSCAAIFRKLPCRSCTATFAFPQCGTASLPKAALQRAKNCTATLKKLHALQESSAFLPLPCGFQAPTFIRKLEKAVPAVRNLIPCWNIVPANFEAAGKFFTDVPAASNAIPAKVSAFSGKENGCWKVGPAFGNAPGLSYLRPPQPSLRILLRVGLFPSKGGAGRTCLGGKPPDDGPSEAVADPPSVSEGLACLGPQTWDTNCLVQGPNSWISLKIDKGRSRAGENRPGDIRPNHFVYTCVGSRASTHVSTRVGAFVWEYNREKTNFCGHSRVHLREHSREHLREAFRGSIGGSYFAFASSLEDHKLLK